MTLKEEEVHDVATPTGPMRTFILRPAANGSYPAIVFYSEIFQVTGPIRRTAALLAGQGFVVAVPEVYHEFLPAGTVLAYDQAGADKGNEIKIGKEVSAWDSDARALLDHLKTQPYCNGKLGTLGICLGGHLAFRCAMQPDILAGACFYATDIHQRSLGKGKCDNTLDRMKEIKGEMMMSWGRQDPHISREGRRLIYDAMTDAGISFTWHEYNGAHAFLRDEGPRYNPALAHTCWGMVFELFKRKLSDGDLPA
jgi:carboxymethylenebutenolidase